MHAERQNVLRALTRDGRLLFAARAVRTFSFGALSVVLALFLTARGLDASDIGFVLSATLIEDAIFTALVAASAERYGRRRVLCLTSLLVVFAGAALAFVTNRWGLIAAAVIGTLSPNGQEAGPFSPIEQALLPDTVPVAARTRAFAWYNVFAYGPSAVGALTAPGVLAIARRTGFGGIAAYQVLLIMYAALGIAMLALYAALSPEVEIRRGGATNTSTVPRDPRRGSRPRPIVLQLASLQALDSLGGSFVVQALLAYWFHIRFGVGADVLGPLLFATSMTSGLSFLAAARVAERFGLLNTMVFTHLPSNVLLALVPFMPNFALAATVLVMRHMLAQMDVPTRQAYTVALVAPDERAAAAGLTTSARALAQAIGPAVTGATMGAAAGATAVPFVLAGAVKIVYDVALFIRFRRVPLPETV